MPHLLQKTDRKVMTILIRIGRLYMGGIEKYAIDLALGLKSKGHNVHLLVFFNVRNEEKKILLQNSGIGIHELKCNSGRDFRLPFIMTKIIKQIKPDIIHLNVLPLFAILSLLYTRSLKVYTIHQITSNKIIASLYKHRINGVIYISQSIKKIFLEQKKYFTRSKWAIINNGVLLPDYKIYQNSNKKVNLVMITRLAQDKHPDHAIEILNYLKNNSTIDYSLTFVGSGDTLDREYVNKLKMMVSSGGLEEKIYFAGWHEDVHPFLKQSHGLLMLSRLECFPYTAIEAFSYGMPVFSYRIKGGLHDIHINGETGIVIDKRDPISLAKEIDKVFQEPSYWEEYSKNAFNKSKYFSIQRMIDETEKFYLQLTHQKHARNI